MLVKLLKRGQTLSKDTSNQEEVKTHLDTWWALLRCESITVWFICRNESVKDLSGILQSHMKLIPDNLLQELEQCNIVLQLSGHEQ